MAAAAAAAAIGTMVITPASPALAAGYVGRPPLRALAFPLPRRLATTCHCGLAAMHGRCGRRHSSSRTPLASSASVHGRPPLHFARQHRLWRGVPGEDAFHIGVYGDSHRRTGWALSVPAWRR